MVRVRVVITDIEKLKCLKLLASYIKISFKTIVLLLLQWCKTLPGGVARHCYDYHTTKCFNHFGLRRQV